MQLFTLKPSSKFEKQNKLNHSACALFEHGLVFNSQGNLRLGGWGGEGTFSPHTVFPCYRTRPTSPARTVADTCPRWRNCVVESSTPTRHDAHGRKWSVNLLAQFLHSAQALLQERHAAFAGLAHQQLLLQVCFAEGVLLVPSSCCRVRLRKLLGRCLLRLSQLMCFFEKMLQFAQFAGALNAGAGRSALFTSWIGACRE